MPFQPSVYSYGDGETPIVPTTTTVPGSGASAWIQTGAQVATLLTPIVTDAVAQAKAKKAKGKKKKTQPAPAGVAPVTQPVSYLPAPIPSAPKTPWWRYALYGGLILAAGVVVYYVFKPQVQVQRNPLRSIVEYFTKKVEEKPAGDGETAGVVAQAPTKTAKPARKNPAVNLRKSAPPEEEDDEGYYAEGMDLFDIDTGGES